MKSLNDVENRILELTDKYDYYKTLGLTDDELKIFKARIYELEWVIE